VGQLNQLDPPHEGAKAKEGWPLEHVQRKTGLVMNLPRGAVMGKRVRISTRRSSVRVSASHPSTSREDILHRVTNKTPAKEQQWFVVLARISRVYVFLVLVQCRPT
jgi:hypothetical protein